jgi:hypothetical protein
MKLQAQLKIGCPVYIEWEDSYGCSSSWEHFPDSADRPQTMICRTLGWVVRKTRRAVVIVPHTAQNSRLGVEQGCGDMTIPIAAIRKVTDPTGARKLALSV